MITGTGTRRAVPAALAGLVLMTAGCSGNAGGASASCAVEIAIGGTDYIGGRDEGAPLPSRPGSELRGTTVPCGDGNPPVVAVVAHTIPGVDVEDAVLGPHGEVMLAQRRWEQSWSALPPALQKYVRH